MMPSISVYPQQRLIVRGDERRKQWLETVCYDLGDNFADHIAKTNGSKFIRRVRSITFQDKGDEGSIGSWE